MRERNEFGAGDLTWRLPFSPRYSNFNSPQIEVVVGDTSVAVILPLSVPRHLYTSSLSILYILFSCMEPAL